MIGEKNTTLDEKLTWSIEEASAMSGIGMKKLRSIYKTAEANEWRLSIGQRFRVKVEPFKRWLAGVTII